MKIKIVAIFLLSLCSATVGIDAGEVMNTEHAQQHQQKFDDEYFEIHEGFEKLRHTLLHLMKTTGKIAAYCEAKEHGKELDTSQLVNEAIPDLLIYALEFANLYDIDLGEKYDERLEVLKERVLEVREKREER